MPEFRYPRTGEHHAVIGQTGSGKTQHAVYFLLQSDFDVRPQIAFDTKGDELLNQIRYANHQKVEKFRIPREPGLTIVHSLPHQKDELEAALWQIWKRGNVGVHIDETYMFDKDSPGLSALLTQGRSKRINMRCLTQRPSWCSRFVFSEASYFSVFHVNDIRDQKTIQGFTPIDFDAALPEFHCHFYDVKQRLYSHLLPVPESSIILNEFEDALKPKRKFI